MQQDMVWPSMQQCTPREGTDWLPAPQVLLAARGLNQPTYVVQTASFSYQLTPACPQLANASLHMCVAAPNTLRAGRPEGGTADQVRAATSNLQTDQAEPQLKGRRKLAALRCDCWVVRSEAGRGAGV